MSPHEQVLQSMQKMAEQFAQQGVNLQLPPPSSDTLGTTFIQIEYGQSLTGEFKFDSRFANPLQIFQGGFLCAALDEVYGPLTYMAAGRPALTIEMSTTFLRPFTAKDESIQIRAEVVSKSKSLLVLRAEVRTRAQRLIATSTSHSLIVQEPALAPPT